MRVDRDPSKRGSLDELVSKLNAFEKLPPIRKDAEDLRKQRLADSDTLIRSITSAVRHTTVAERERARRRLRGFAAEWILDFALSCAQEAVRRCDPELISVGLIAVVFEGGKHISRESHFPLGALLHSCTLLGIDPVPLFRDASALSTGPDLREEVECFPHRKPKARCLKAFGMRAIGSGSDFRYVIDWLSWTSL